MSELELVFHRPGARGLAWGSLLTVLHARLPDAGDFGEMHAAYSTLVDRYGLVSSITVLLALPALDVDAELRERSVKITRDFGSISKGGAIVIPASGMRASFVRSVITGFTLVARPQHPQRVFQAVPSAVDWVTQLEGQPAELGIERGNIAHELEPHVREMTEIAVNGFAA